MESVAFYSYKGGVGRSLLLVNTARFLALSGRRVVAIDLDFEAPGLHYKTGVEGRVSVGAVRLLERSLSGDLPTLDDVREACLEVPMPATHGGWLRLLAAGPAPKSEYWADLGRLNERLTASQDAGLLEAMLDLQARIEEAWNPDVLLIDARTGVTGLGGIVTMALCERVVLVTTRARESLDGVCAVADSLRATPTLRGGERRLEFVVSRVQGTEAVDDQALHEVFGEYFELPHDAYDGGAERLFGDGSVPLASSMTALDEIFRDSLLARTLTWISEMFPTEADLANRARARLVATEETWRELTDWRKRMGGRMARERWHWSPDMLSTNVEFSGSDGSARTADIVARLDSGEQAMIIEYVDDEPGPDIARWWSEHTTIRVIVLLLRREGDQELQRMICSGTTRGRDVDHGELPSPVEFEILRDPTDRSVEAMLEVAPRTRFYDERLILEWERSAVVSLRGVGRHRPEQARKILAGLAAIEEVERAKEVAWECIIDSPSRARRSWGHAPQDDLHRLVLEGLCAPLCWRAPPRAFIELARRQQRGPVPAFFALRRLACFMGLDYEPHAVFRREAAKLVGGDADVDSVTDTMQARELEFEWSTDPLATVSEPAPRSHGYHGYLGSYTLATEHIMLAAPTIEAVAQSLDRAPRHVGSVTLLHLSVLGMLHNGIDLDGERWEGFSSGDPVTLALAQFFVHRFLVELDDERLLDAFEALTDSQPPEHGAWRAMAHVSLEAGRAWMMAIRRGTSGPAPVDLDELLRKP